MMVPLRRALIVKEHGVLPYPEGTACAEVLVAGERGGKLAAIVFRGLGIGALWKGLSWIVTDLPNRDRLHRCRANELSSPTRHSISTSRPSTWASDTSSARASPARCSPAACLSWLVLLPLLSILGELITVPFRRSIRTSPITRQAGSVSDLEMNARQLWSAYIRYIGAGAVLAAGFITLARTIPTIVSSFRGSVRDFGGRRRRGSAAPDRT